ncbi:MAG: gamma carbonic anhydrase family protein [Blastocatellia bacterium]
MIYRFNGKTPKINESAFIATGATIVGDVEIADDASIWFGSVLRGDVNFIRIGARTNIQDQTIIHVSSEGLPTIIAEEVTVGHRVTLHACSVERGCLIGMGAILMDGVRVGSESLIAAGTLVPPGTEIPPRSLVIGSPGRLKRQLTKDEILDLDRSWRRYVELKNVYLSGQAALERGPSGTKPVND